MRFDLPDGSGWFDLLDVRALTVDNQDEYWELRDELERARLAEVPPPQPDPANPAVMLPQPEVKLTRKDIARIQCLVASWIVQGTSFEGVLPWHDGSRAAMGLGGWNFLRATMAEDGGHFDALVGVVPKASPTSSVTSGTSSADGADAPPEGSAPQTSDTPTG